MPESTPNQIDGTDLLLYRQIHPMLLKSNGAPSSESFLPEPTSVNFRPEQGSDLSTRNGEKVDAKGAHQAHVALGIESIGTWGFTAQEAVALDMTVWDDGGCDGLPDCHVTVRYPRCESRRKQERLAKKLQEAARQRGHAGWLYFAGDSQDGVAS